MTRQHSPNGCQAAMVNRRSWARLHRACISDHAATGKGRQLHTRRQGSRDSPPPATTKRRTQSHRGRRRMNDRVGRRAANSASIPIHLRTAHLGAAFTISMQLWEAIAIAALCRTGRLLFLIIRIMLIQPRFIAARRAALPVEFALGMMEVSYRRPPWLSASYHPRSTDRQRHYAQPAMENGVQFEEGDRCYICR